MTKILAVEAAQVAQDDFAGDVGADVDHFKVHDGADLMVGVGHCRLYLRAFCGVARAQRFVHDFARQVVGEFRQFVGVQIIHRRQHFVLIHHADEAFAHGVGDFEQHFAVFFRHGKVPNQHPFFLRQGFEDVGDIRRVQFDEIGVEFGERRLLRGVVQMCRPGHDGGSSGHQGFNELVDALNIG